MRARIRVIDGHGPAIEVPALRRWLTDEDELRGRIDVEQSGVEPGQLGGIAEVLVATLGSGGAVTVLAGSLATWLKQRRSDVKIEVTGPDGRTVTVSADRVPDPAALVDQVLRSRELDSGR